MKMISKQIRKLIAILSIVVMIFTVSPLQVSAYVTLTESESNNTVSTADITYDDHNNYGTLHNATDVDW